MDKTNFFFGTLPFSLSIVLSHMVTYRSSSKMTRKMNIHSNLDKNSPWAHMEAEFGVLSVVFRDCEICSSLLQKEENKK
jgi:hypothetical protein